MDTHENLSETVIKICLIFLCHLIRMYSLARLLTLHGWNRCSRLLQKHSGRCLATVELTVHSLVTRQTQEDADMKAFYYIAPHYSSEKVLFKVSCSPFNILSSNCKTRDLLHLLRIISDLLDYKSVIFVSCFFHSRTQ